jgi:hypothetical protein
LPWRQGDFRDKQRPKHSHWFVIGQLCLYKWSKEYHVE